MSFQIGESGNPLGRPRGARTAITVPKTVTRQVLKAVCARALAGDERAQELVLRAAFGGERGCEDMVHSRLPIRAGGE